MSKHVVLVKYTDKGLATIKESPNRAAAFATLAEKANIKIETQLWTTGLYDGLLVLDAPDEATATGLVIGLCEEGHVSTCMLRAFGVDEFRQVLKKAH